MLTTPLQPGRRRIPSLFYTLPRPALPSLQSVLDEKLCIHVHGRNDRATLTQRRDYMYAVNLSMGSPAGWPDPAWPKNGPARPLFFAQRARPGQRNLAQLTRQVGPRQQF
jgi:hypothetical protein